MPVRWGIAGSGAISADFALGVLASEHATLTAVAARTEERAQAFAKTYGASKSYGSYKALAQDPDIDVVYVGVTNQQHKHVSSLLLNAGKGVLCEKPATTSGADTAELINTALANNVFFMEGVWTKFFPIYTQLCSLIQDGHLGRVTYFSAAFAPGNELNEDATHEELLSKQRLWDPEYYGGILVGTSPCSCMIVLLLSLLMCACLHVCWCSVLFKQPPSLEEIITWNGKLY